MKRRARLDVPKVLDADRGTGKGCVVGDGEPVDGAHEPLCFGLHESARCTDSAAIHLSIASRLVWSTDRVAYLCALRDCTMPKNHPVRRRLQQSAMRVLEAPIRVAPASRFPVVNKEEFENFLEGRPVLTSERRRVNPGQNRYYLRDLILENPGISYAGFRARYGHVMPKVTRGSFDTTRWVLKRAGYPLPSLRRCRVLA